MIDYDCYHLTKCYCTMLFLLGDDLLGELPYYYDIYLIHNVAMHMCVCVCVRGRGVEVMN